MNHPNIAPDAQIRDVLNLIVGFEPACSQWALNSNYILIPLTGILWLVSGVLSASFYEKNLKQPIQLSFDVLSNDKSWIQIGG